MKYILFAILLAGLCMSCDPYYTIEFKVKNDSKEQIKIFVHENTSVDSNYIAAGTEIMFRRLADIGSTTKNKLERMTELPFDSIHISTWDNRTCKRDINRLSKWNKIYHKKEDLGEVILRLRNDDF